MDIGSIPSKIASNADKLGMAVGAISYLASCGGGDFIKGAQAILGGLVEKPHMPNLGHVWVNLIRGEMNHTFPTAVGAAIAGWVLKEIDILPQANKIGEAVMKAGIGAAEASVVLAVLAHSGQFFSTTYGADAGLGGGSHFNFLGGSRHNPHGAYSEPSVAPLGTKLTRSGPSSPSPYT
jgi:hypothetical protein